MQPLFVEGIGLVQSKRLGRFCQCCEVSANWSRWKLWSGTPRRGYVWLEWPNSSATRIFADVVISRVFDDIVEGR